MALPLTSNPTGAPRKVLVLYTELAPDVRGCLQTLANDHNTQVHIVHWPVNSEAPFQLKYGHGLHHYERAELGADELVSLALKLKPDLVLCSGWIDKGYLKVCRRLRKKGTVTVMCSDTAWRGDAKQIAASVAGRILFPSIFSHAWVTGEGQKRYALNLGFAEQNIRTGFYAADTERFLALGDQLLKERTEKWPHRFICVARYIAIKKHQLLCDAFAELTEEGRTKDWELWFTGTGELFDQVSNSPTGKNPKIRHMGFVQPEAMPEVLRQCGVFILPSTYEPWGVVVQEHACAGFPLALSSEIRAAERFLQIGQNGSSFAADNKVELKNAMLTFIDSTDAELAAMGSKSKELGDTWGPTQWAKVAAELMGNGYA